VYVVNNGSRLGQSWDVTPRFIKNDLKKNPTYIKKWGDSFMETPRQGQLTIKNITIKKGLIINKHRYIKINTL